MAMQNVPKGIVADIFVMKGVPSLKFPSKNVVLILGIKIAGYK